MSNTFNHLNRNTLQTLLVLYDLHSRLFVNVIDGIDTTAAHCRFNTKANHIAWLTGSLVHERYELAMASGVHIVQPFNDLFENHKGIIDDIEYPSLADFKTDWETITPLLRQALTNLTESQLCCTEIYSTDDADVRFIDAITFIVDRESYCIGQIGLYRRLLGYAAMKYE